MIRTKLKYDYRRIARDGTLHYRNRIYQKEILKQHIGRQVEIYAHDNSSVLHIRDAEKGFHICLLNIADIK